MNIIIISNEKMKDIMKIVKCLKESGLLIKVVGKTTRTEAKVLRYQEICQQVKQFYELVKEQLEQATILTSPHLLLNFEIQKYYENKPEFKGVF